MKPLDFETYIHGVGNDLKFSIDDIISVLFNLCIDVEALKFKTFKPTPEIAKILLKYINSKRKKKLHKEIQPYLQWLDQYCSENCHDRELTLKMLIDGEI